MTKGIIKKGILILLIYVISMFVFQTKSECASFSVSAKQNLTTGESTTFTLSLSDGLGKFSITSSDSSVISISGDAVPWFESSGNHSVTLKANKAGKATITATAVNASNAEGTEDLTGSKSVTITVSDPTPPPAESNKSGDANLKSITVAGQTYTNPSTDFTVKVGANVASTEVSAQTSSGAAKVSGTGKKELSTGSNIVTLTVTAENGQSKKYTVRINKAADTSVAQPNRVDTPNNNPEPEPEPQEEEPQDEPEALRLTYLMIEGVELLPEFDSEVFEYTVSVTNLDKLDIVKVANSEEAVIEITGNDELVNGENVIIIKLTKGEEVVEYKITATKETVNLTQPEEENQQVEEEKSFLEKNGWMIGTGACIALIAIIILIYVFKGRKTDEMLSRTRHSHYDDGGFDE